MLARIDRMNILIKQIREQQRHVLAQQLLLSATPDGGAAAGETGVAQDDLSHHQFGQRLATNSRTSINSSSLSSLTSSNMMKQSDQSGTTAASSKLAAAAASKALTTMQHDDFTLIRELGRGSSGLVHLALVNGRIGGGGGGGGGDDIDSTSTKQEKDDQQQYVAIKSVTVRHHGNALREAMLLAPLRHPNLISVIGTAFDGFSLYTIMDYCSGGTLNQRVEHELSPSRETTTTTTTTALTLDPCFIARIQLWTAQIGAALEYLHFNHTIHRDVKPDNILLSNSDDIKLGDLASGKRTTGTSARETFCGTPVYMAPEVLDHSKHSEAADMWSMGCVVYYLCSGRDPFNGESMFQLMRSHRDGPPPLSSDVPPNIAELVWQLLQNEPELRPSGGALMRTAWVTKELSAWLDRDAAEAEAASEPMRLGSRVPMPMPARSSTSSSIRSSGGSKAAPVAPARSSVGSGSASVSLSALRETEPAPPQAQRQTHYANNDEEDDASVNDDATQRVLNRDVRVTID